jgi:signal transduction histidine kinase
MNTPIGNALMVLSSIRGESKDDESLELIETSLRRIAGVVDKIKVLQDSGGENRMLDISEYIGEFIAMHRGEIEQKGIDFRFVSPEVESIPVAPWTFLRILEELYSNTITHGLSQESGSPPPEILIEVRPAGNEVLLSWSDNGPGIPDDILPEVFDPYFTTCRSSDHSGLGLFNLKSMVEQYLGGSVEVESAAGKGLTVTIRLPKDSEA